MRSAFAFFCLALLFVATPAQANALEANNRIIAVNAIGEVEAAVDNATLAIEIVARDKSLEAAKAASDKKYSAFLQLLTEKFKLGNKVIKNNFVSAYPIYQICDEQNILSKQCDKTKVEYFQLSRSISLKLDDLKIYDQLIGDISGIDARVQSSNFGVADIEKYQDKSREIALKAAQAKAQKIADIMGVKLSKPFRIESYENEVSTAMPQPRAMKMMSASADFAPTNPETLGKIKVQSNVNLQYEFE